MTLLNMISDKQKTLKPPADLKFHKDEQGNIFAVQLRVRAWDELLSQLPNPEEFDEKVFQPPESSAYVFIRIEDWRNLFIKNLSHSATSVTTSQSKSIKKAIPTDHFGDGTSRVFAKADGWTTYQKPVKRPKGETFKDLPIDGDEPQNWIGDPPAAGSWQDQARKKSSEGKKPKKRHRGMFPKPKKKR